MKPPFLYKEKKPLVWSIDQWVELTGQLAEIGALKSLSGEAKKRGIRVLLPPETVNFIKMFLFEGRYHKKHKTARNLITSATCPKKPDPRDPIDPINNPKPDPKPRPDPKPKDPKDPKPKATKLKSSSAKHGKRLA